MGSINKKSSWVDFSAIKQNVSFITILDHYSLTDTLKRKGDKFKFGLVRYRDSIVGTATVAIP